MPKLLTPIILLNVAVYCFHNIRNGKYNQIVPYARDQCKNPLIAFAIKGQYALA